MVLVILWALNTNAPNVAFWMILRIAADAALLLRIRSEIKPFAKVLRVTPGGDADLQSSATDRLQISVEGLTNTCPLLKATFLECNRLHTLSISFRTIKRDFILTNDNAKRDGYPRSYLIEKNSYLYVPHFHHQFAPENFSDPHAFTPERFLTPPDAEGRVSVDAKTLRPFGGGASMCKGRWFAEREVLAFVAGFLTLWDIEAAEGGEIKIPRNVRTTASCRPDGPCRVRIRKRDLVV